MHSWRVLILPYLCGLDIYNQYRFDEPWDSPHNRKLANSRGVQPVCLPHGRRHFRRNQLRGSRRTRNDVAGLKGRPIRDGTSKTIAIVEVANSGIHWMEPRDIAYKDALQGINADTNAHTSPPSTAKSQAYCGVTIE